MRRVGGANLGRSRRWAVPSDTALTPEYGWMIGEQYLPSWDVCEPLGPEPYWSDRSVDFASNLCDAAGPGRAALVEHGIYRRSVLTAWDHRFGVDLFCECGVSWGFHQAIPTRCAMFDYDDDLDGNDAWERLTSRLHAK